MGRTSLGKVHPRPVRVGFGRLRAAPRYALSPMRPNCRPVTMRKGREVTVMKLGEMPPRDLALLAVAVALMLGGAVTLVGGWIAAAIAIPVIAVGIALVAIERADVHRQHVPG